MIHSNGTSTLLERTAVEQRQLLADALVVRALPPDEVRGAYNRAQWIAERTKLMQWWADRLDKMRKGADVLPMKAA